MPKFIKFNKRGQRIKNSKNASKSDRQNLALDDVCLKFLLVFLSLIMIFKYSFTPDEIVFTFEEVFGKRNKTTNITKEIHSEEEFETDIDIVEENESLDKEENLIDDLEELLANKNFTEVDDLAENVNIETEVIHNDRVIILYSLHKQETTLISDLFNIHPDVFYLHEPLSLIHHGCESIHSSIASQLGDINEYIPAAEKHAIQWLDKFSQCNFTSTVKPIVDKLSNKDHHIPGSFPHRYKSAKLCKSTFCSGQDYSFDPKNCWKKCPPVNLHRAEITCQESRVKVVQTIRVCKIGELHRLVHKGRILRVVLVARDPRAVAMSKVQGS